MLLLHLLVLSSWGFVGSWGLLQLKVAMGAVEADLHLLLSVVAPSSFFEFMGVCGFMGAFVALPSL